MAPTIPSSEPTEARAGDSWRWRHSHPDYPISEGWALSYSFRGPDAPIWQSSWVSNDGSQFTVVIPATETTLWTAGRYAVTRHYTGSGTYAGQAFSEALDPLLVAANPANQAAGATTSHAETMLPLVEAAIQGLVSFGSKEYSIGGRTFRRNDLGELYRLRRLYRAEVRALRYPGRSAPRYEVTFGVTGAI